MKTEEQKIQEVINRLDGISCICGQKEDSRFHWIAPGRMSVVCRVCDADLILDCGGTINLNKWSKNVEKNYKEE